MADVKIFIVEDEKETLRFIKNCLQRELLCDIDESMNGIDAIEKMKAQDFDLVILDLKMPGVNGLDVMREIKKIKKLPDILVVTAWDSDQVATTVIKEGALDYMPKPLIPEAFMIKVKTLLDKKGKYIPKKK